MDKFNLLLTGDIDAIITAKNLLAAQIDEDAPQADPDAGGALQALSACEHRWKEMVLARPEEAPASMRRRPLTT